MKTTVRSIIIALAALSPAFAGSDPVAEGNSLLITLFLAFGALIIAFQLVPGMILLYSMLKGIFSAADKKSAVVETAQPSGEGE